ncbi:MAG: alpha/beta hydrolase family protein [Arenimonas sp.]
MEIEVSAADGHRFAVHWHPACARGGPALLFLPALAVSASRYERFAQALNTQGVSVAVPDWRGLASSSLRPGRDHDWGYRDLLEVDLAATRAALAAHAPGERWAIGGHSLGGQLAALAAAMAPGDFVALVLVATGVPDARLFSGRNRWGVRLLAGAIPALTRLFGYFPGDRLRWAGREAATLMRQWAGTVLTGDYSNVGIRDAEARLRALPLPMLGVRLSDDWLAGEASMRALADKLGPGPRTFEVIDGARLGDRPDHFRWLKSPAVPAAIIAGWLRINP